MVRAEGLEPPRLAPPEPKSGVSASSTTPAPACRFDPSPFQARARGFTARRQARQALGRSSPGQSSERLKVTRHPREAEAQRLGPRFALGDSHFSLQPHFDPSPAVDGVELLHAATHTVPGLRQGRLCIARTCRPAQAAPVRSDQPSTSFATVTFGLAKNRPASPRSSPPRLPPRRPTGPAQSLPSGGPSARPLGPARGQAPAHRLARDHLFEDRPPFVEAQIPT
jgi:hypothetical protein